MTRKQKHLLARIVIAAILFFAGSLFYLPEYMEAGIFLAEKSARIQLNGDVSDAMLKEAVEDAGYQLISIQ